jgi:kinesin family protein 22
MALDDKDGNLQLKGLAWVIYSAWSICLLECSFSSALTTAFSWLKVSVRSMEEFQEVYSIFRNGCAERKVAHTGLNDVSSRSHDVLSIRISNDTFKGNLNLIDLAGTTPCNEVHITYIGFTFQPKTMLCCIFISGNEDNRRTYNDGIHLQESSKINSSLFTLSNVISALKKMQMCFLNIF